MYHELKLYSTIGTSEHAKTFWLYVLGDRCASQVSESWPSEGVGDRERRHQHECGGICSECLDRFRVNMTLGACQIDTDELGHCVSWMQRPEDRGQPWRGDLL
ncbi:hypothetical protein B0H13DRAFT_1916128 [Mycena leptocephala]|nr:hypothetical protein B0H13DRAFT_1916128 [Mycena leptocephala]